MFGPPSLFFVSLKILTVSQNVVTVEFFLVPTLHCAEFFLRTQMETQLVLCMASRCGGKRTCGQTHGQNHSAGKAKELEKEFHEKMKKCFED